MTMINVKMMLLSHFIFSKKKNKKGEWNTKYSVPQLMIAKKVSIKVLSNCMFIEIGWLNYNFNFGKNSFAHFLHSLDRIISNMSN